MIMINLNKASYPYMEEVNDGILREFRRLLPFTGRVLDVGCGRGQLGAAVRQLGWEVWGVEQSDEACAAAGERLDRLIRADLNDLEGVHARLGDVRFDALIFSDVLEHVYDPLGVLEKYLVFVKPGGRAFISVPNMVVWTNRLKLMFGCIRYADTGVMDRTHIRFFTFDTGKELVAAAGCSVDRVASTPYLVRAVLPLLKRSLVRHAGDAGGAPDPRALIDSKLYVNYMKYLYPTERWLASLWRAMFGFRIIVVGTKLPRHRGRHPAERRSPVDACRAES
jgi:2-polyprenyl-3-methyl-5-hydroxy-6-metoxy-1,4-benzoquinol methylase